jgi:pterin-4a-carbinolamine dehydratase
MAAIEMTTHAIGGLSENDFILAAKIDEVSS